MASVTDLRDNGSQVTNVATPIIEPLAAQEIFGDKLRRFGDHYNTSQNSHLYRYLVALCGEAGSGSAKKELLLPKLFNRLESTQFLNLDRLYGDSLALPRLDAEVYTIDPENQILTQAQWNDVRSKDASYRERCLYWMRAILEGPTKEGLKLVGKAALGVECDVLENPAATTAGIAVTTSLNEFVIIPRTPTITEQDRRRLARLIDKLKPGGTLHTVYLGNTLRNPRSVFHSAASSTRFSVQKNVTGRTDINWPPIDASSGLWIQSAIQNEAPTFAFMDRQESVTYITIDDIDASSEHVGQFNPQQKSLFVNLAKNFDDFLDFSADRAIAKNIAPLNIQQGFVNTSSHEAHDTIVANIHYPLSYFTLNGVTPTQDDTADIFWSSIEQLAPQPDRLVMKFNLPRPVNFVTFEMTPKPFDILIEYDDGTGNFLPVVDSGDNIFSPSMPYMPAAENPWVQFEYHFEQVSTPGIRITFTRRVGNFPLPGTDPFPYSVDVRGLRLMHVVAKKEDFVVDTGTDILGNAFISSLTEYPTSNLFAVDLTDTSAVLTTSGNEITDVTRTTNTQGDGRLAPDSTFGIWQASTNLVRNGGMETNTTEWAAVVGSTISRDTTKSKFGTSSLKVVTTAVSGTGANYGTATALSVTVGQTYTYSAWVFWPTGQAGQINLDWRTSGGTPISSNPTNFIGTGNWQYVTTTAVAPATATKAFIEVYTLTATVTTFWVDGAQVENLNTATPYIHTDGGTASRSDARVQASGLLLDESKGWFGMRLRMGYLRTQMPTSTVTFFDWLDSVSSRLVLYQDATSIWFQRASADGSSQAGAHSSFAPGDTLTIICKWSPTNIGISVNGAPFINVANNFIPFISDTLFDIGGAGTGTAPMDSTIHWFACGLGVLSDQDALILSTFNDPSSQWPLQSRGLTALMPFNTANYITPTHVASSYWHSQPNPSKNAVEALYFDLRVSDHAGTMNFLDGLTMDELDSRGQTDIEIYYSDGQVVDEVFVDPIYPGSNMQFYYSNDDTPEWDDKLWVPIPRNYICTKGYHALPSPQVVRYFKIEFSNLPAQPYQPIEYPTMPLVTYNVFPTWVTDYFTAVNPSVVVPTSFEQIETINYEPLDLFQKVDDRYGKTFEQIREDLEVDHDPEIATQIEKLLSSQVDPVPQIQIEDTIQYNSVVMWQKDLFQQIDSTKALGRKTLEPRAGITDTGFNAELGLPAYTPPLQQSVTDLTAVAVDKLVPAMWWPRVCRHGYKVVQASLDAKVVYSVAIKEVEFHRRNYAAVNDEPVYIETLDDTAHIAASDFTQGQFAYNVGT